MKRPLPSIGFWHRIVAISEMGPQDPKDVTRDTARDLSGMAGELAALKADAHHRLPDAE